MFCRSIEWYIDMHLKELFRSCNAWLVWAFPGQNMWITSFQLFLTGRTMPGVNIGAIKKWSMNIKKAQPSSLSVPYCHIDRSRNLCFVCFYLGWCSWLLSKSPPRSDATPTTEWKSCIFSGHIMVTFTRLPAKLSPSPSPSPSSSPSSSSYGNIIPTFAELPVKSSPPSSLSS